MNERGFRRSSAGWWTRTTRNGQRVQLVGEMLTTLGEDISDLLVRDVEYLANDQAGDR